MQEFFSQTALEQIKSNESPPEIVENFLIPEEVKKLLDFEINASNRFVERKDGRKTGLGVNGEIGKSVKDWDPVIKEILLEKIEKKIGRFDVVADEYPPHFFRTVFPVSMHADTGHDSNAIIGKQILIPLEVVPESSKAQTILFNRKWYGPASNFISKNPDIPNSVNHHVLPDANGKFITFDDVKKFYDVIKDKKNETVKINEGIFEISEEFKEYVKSLIGNKRYNQMTNKHIINEESFDKIQYQKFLTHIDYYSLQSLKIEKIFEWKPTSALIWDRTTLHASNNYLVDGVKNKLGIAIFTVKK
tara:strand:+ start:8426 stop:9337 length:912 start_codon:yes stop_codon:yes gene_type:complete